MLLMRWWVGYAFHHLEIWSMLYARVAPTFLLIPLVSSRIVVNPVTRQLIICFIVIGLAPHAVHPVNGASGIEIAFACATEAIVGIVVGVIVAGPFWVASLLGELIDNQRGATIADSIDPASGVEAAILAPFLNLMFANVFLQNGGLTVLMSFYAKSLLDVPLGEIPHFNYVGLVTLMNHVIQMAVSLSAPVAAGLLLLDGVLAFLSRFCKQLNAFSLSLTLKSLGAYGIMYFYFASTVPIEIYHLVDQWSFRGILQ
ncbi:type III secretion system export apparatus subunit SctT [Robbsia sp. Bb-Pol-6]|uniref:Type III secretion system export apparatus subunit SctT n=1 Tax=Robbsia betulipollinis TaxID=2981849 RepID=A0ABT3ZL08_9BURK|nr:type III secretion system export apparatus subunit SctT [Robbsia betulipollinis]MCY0387223.1 type III secretion system export apparatus subunit SctT [Robbsia betulipollinis]